MPVVVLDTKFENDEIWLKVTLGRNTDILEKILFTDREIDCIKEKAIKEFMHNLVDKLLDSI